MNIDKEVRKLFERYVKQEKFTDRAAAAELMHMRVMHILLREYEAGGIESSAGDADFYAQRSNSKILGGALREFSKMLHNKAKKVRGR